MIQKEEEEEEEEQEDESIKGLNHVKNINEEDISEEGIGKKPSVNDSTSFESNVDAFMDYALSEASQDDTSSTIGPTINVIACNENPASGCSYLTSSLSSYQVS